MRLNLTENEKVKGLLKKGLGKFQRDVAKFSLGLGLLSKRRREIFRKPTHFYSKTQQIIRFLNISRQNNAILSTCQRAVRIGSDL